MELKLYMFETCPFCRKVLNEIESSGRTDGKPMYESDDIVAWLRANPQQV